MAKGDEFDLMDNEAEFEITADIDLANLEQSLQDEGKKIGTLESLVNGFISSKITQSDDGKVKVDMTAKEISEIATASDKIMSMRRRNNGFQE
jgi:hypothetical protein